MGAQVIDPSLYWSGLKAIEAKRNNSADLHFEAG